MSLVKPIKNVRSFYKDPTSFLSGKDNGSICSFKMLHLNFHYISGAQQVREVLANNHKNIVKTPDAQYFTALAIGEGLLSTDHEDWTKKRKSAAPAFNYSYLNELIQDIDVTTKEALDKIESSNEESLNTLLLELTLNIICQVSFGKSNLDNLSEIQNIMDVLITETYKKVVAPVRFPMSLPTPTNNRFNRERKKYHSIIQQLTNQALNKDPNNSLIWKFTNDPTSNISEETKDELCVVFKTIVAAGHETTASTLTWLVYEVENNPEVKKQLLAEIENFEGHNLDGKTIFENSKYLQQVINETMRLYPPIWLMGRMATKEFKIDDTLIKRHDNILISPFVLHRSEHFWSSPNIFDPSRFEHNNHIDDGYFIPFGLGPRQCIGSHLAIIEMIIIVTQLYSKFDIKLKQPNNKVKLNPFVTLRPSSDINIEIKKK